jgi:hypothetical protein
VRAAGVPVRELVAARGASKSREWMQLRADVTGVPIAHTEFGAAAVLGRAILAAAGRGIYPNVREAARATVHQTETLELDRRRHDAYRLWVDAYAETYARMGDLVQAVARKVDERGPGRAAARLRCGQNDRGISRHSDTATSWQGDKATRRFPLAAVGKAIATVVAGEGVETSRRTWRQGDADDVSPLPWSAHSLGYRVCISPAPSKSQSSPRSQSSSSAGEGSMPATSAGNS